MKQEIFIASNQDRIILSEEDYKNLTSIPSSSFRIDFESEKFLEENTLIKSLKSLGYEFFDIVSFSKENKQKTHNDSLLLNLRTQLQRLNNYYFSDLDWEKFCKKFNKEFDDLRNKQKIKSFIQDGLNSAVIDFEDSNGNIQQICFLNKRDIHKNHLQVMHQYSIKNSSENINNRYDVTLLINGLPLVHVELKKRGVSLKNAFEQIQEEYSKSMSLTKHLFNFVQLFVISNGTNTKYFANDEKSLQSIDFASTWTSEKNQKINDLYYFSQSFFNKNTLLKILTDYCVYTEPSYDNHRQLIVMRPYQICAVEKILEQVNKTILNKDLIGKKDGGGYIWHTTGSGKTLTSFKAATLIKKKFPQIGKIVFVVDRQDLDYQTMKEYDKFQKDCVASSKNTKQLFNLFKSEDDEHKIIVTTIQKLNNLIINENKYDLDKNLKNKPIVFIFDECHRSQFGSQQHNIKKTFKNHIMFGFTGTPIFTQNANVNLEGKKLTTDDIFGKNLHSYTIADSINDSNTLPFAISYINTFDKNLADNVYVEGIDESTLFLNDDRINLIAKYIINHFNTYTLRVSNRQHKNSLQEFTAMLATSNIKAAKMYYKSFKQINHDLKIAIIYSSPSNENLCLLEENNDSVDGLINEDKEFLSFAINDYNKIFKTNHSINEFKNYYQDVSKKVKSSEIDLLIVVNMFLTGFDSKYLNTLFVDKKLQYHSLIQAYSRTNRTVDIRKNHGNVVCFRNLQQEIEDAISLFGNTETKKILISKSFNEMYEEYQESIKNLISSFPLNGTQVVFKHHTEEEKIEFINLMREFLHKKQKIKSYPDFIGKEIISNIEEADYTSMYRDLEDEYKRKNKKNLSTISSKEVSFDINLALRTFIDTTSIFNIILKHKKENQNNEFSDEIKRLLNNHPELRSKRDLIKDFMNKEKMFINNDGSYKSTNEIMDNFNDFLKSSLKDKIDEIIKNGLTTSNGSKILLKDNITNEQIINIIEKNEFLFNDYIITDLMKGTLIFSNNKNEDDFNVKQQFLKEEFSDLRNKYF